MLGLTRVIIRRQENLIGLQSLRGRLWRTFLQTQAERRPGTYEALVTQSLAPQYHNSQVMPAAFPLNVDQSICLPVWTRRVLKHTAFPRSMAFLSDALVAFLIAGASVVQRLEDAMPALTDRTGVCHYQASLLSTPTSCSAWVQEAILVIRSPCKTCHPAVITGDEAGATSPPAADASSSAAEQVSEVAALSQSGIGCV